MLMSGVFVNYCRALGNEVGHFDLFNLLLFVVGIVACCYWGYALKILFFDKIRLDMHLNKKFLFLKCFLLIMSFPLVVNVGITLSNALQDKKLDERELISDETLYADYYGSADSIVVNTKSRISDVDSFLIVANGGVVCDSNSFVVYSEPFENKKENPSILWSMYIHYMDPGNQPMAHSARGRFVAGLIAALGIVLLNGVLVSVLVGWIDKRKERWLKGEIIYKLGYWRNHEFRKNLYLIIGGNDLVPGIVKHILKGTKNRVFIMTGRDVESFRRQLFSDLNNDEQDRVVILYGDRTSCEDVEKLPWRYASELYVLGEDFDTNEDDSCHDTFNIACIKLVVGACSRFRAGVGKLTCRVMFENQTTFSVIQIAETDSKIVKDLIAFKPFNYYEMWAQKVLVNREMDENSAVGVYKPLEGYKGIKNDSDDFVHLIVVGMSRMGVGMAIEAAHLCHFPNFPTKGVKTRITFIDRNAEQEMNFFMGRFKELFALSDWRFITKDSSSECRYKSGYLGDKVTDVEWEFIAGGVEMPWIQSYLLRSVENPNAKVSIAVCLPESNKAIAAAIYLPDEVYASKQLQQVLVYQRYGDATIQSINEHVRYNSKLIAFGMADSCYDVKFMNAIEKVTLFSDKMYEFINSICERNIVPKAKTQTDVILLNMVNEVKSITHYKSIWKQIPVVELKDPDNIADKQVQENKKRVVGKSQSAAMWSNIYNALTIWCKLRSVCSDEELTQLQCGDFNFTKEHLEQIELMAQVEHYRWNMEQLILRVKPLNEEQQGKFKGYIEKGWKADFDYFKKKLKGEGQHLDICSYDYLNYVDPDPMIYDKCFVAIAPLLYKELKDKC